MKHILLLLFGLLPLGILAQEENTVTEDFRVTCRAYSVDGMKPKPGTPLRADAKKTAVRAWYACVPADMAYRIKDEFKRINKNDEKAVENFKKQKGLRVRPNGVFGQRSRVGFAILCLHEDAENGIEVFEIKPGQTNFESLEYSNAIGVVNVNAKNKVKGRVIGLDTGDGNEVFTISMPLNKGYFTDNSRLILQCDAMDCQTEDTIDYCTPVVFEGPEYHELQDRRKDYDYFHKDSLAVAYKGSYAELDTTSDGQMLINTRIVYRKPDRNKDYRGDWAYSIEDYNRPLTSGFFGGTCLKLRPFKFLNFQAAIPEMELSAEFQETAEINTHDVSTKLDLRFVTGKSILKDDSLNYVNRDNLIKELRSYGDRLVSPKIIGGASPDGSLAKNIQLAKERAGVARNMIVNYLPRRQQLSSDYKVYTWSDVADSLENRGMKAQANEIRGIIESIGEKNDVALFRTIQKLPYYGSDTIQTILTNQRMMQCSYSYIIERVFTSEEVVDEWHNNKRDYLQGKKHFSSGDFYNLFSNIQDSTDVDSITILAYKELKKNPTWFVDRLSPYILNQMQRLQQRLGMADTTMLKPYLRTDPSDSIGIEVFKNFEGIPVKLNRRDLLLTQAMSYYQMQKFSDALSIFEWLKSENKTLPGMERLENFMNIRSLYGKELTAEQEVKLKRAKDYVLSLSDENKAILYTEIPEWSTPQEAEDYVDLLDDNNPKKWYLKGILWSRKANEAQPNLQEYEDTTAAVADSLAVDDNLGMYDMGDDFDVDNKEVRHYLAYFHHCFKMQPEYLKLYYRDGQIGDELRKKYKYLRKDVPEYERLFKLLKRRDDKRRIEVMHELGIIEDEVADEPAATDSNATTQEATTEDSQNAANDNTQNAADDNKNANQENK